MRDRLLSGCMLAPLCVVLLAASAGCGSAGAERARRVDLAPARDFKAFTLFFAGRSYQGLRLTADGSDDLRPYYRGSSVNFTYGDCDSSQNSEGRCSAPLAIVNSPICAENLSLYRRRDVGRRLRLRGVPAVELVGAKRHFWKLLLFSGKTTVTIDGFGYEKTLDVARHLEPLNRRPRRTLQRPVPGGMDGRLTSCAPSRE